MIPMNSLELFRKEIHKLHKVDSKWLKRVTIAIEHPLNKIKTFQSDALIQAWVAFMNYSTFLHPISFALTLYVSSKKHAPNR